MSTIAGLFSVENTATSTKYTIAMADLWNILEIIIASNQTNIWFWFV